VLAYSGKGDYIVTFDPLDGSSILDTNFAIGSIFAIWKKDNNKLIGAKVSDSLITGVIVVYGPRTTAIIYNDKVKAVQELTLVKKQWETTESELTIAKEAKIYAPGNLRAASENKEYLEVMNKWMARGLTLRYSGGLVPDINQLFIKGNGIFVAVASPSHKAKLRVLYEVAPVVFLIEKAGGKTVARKCESGMDYVIKSYNDKLEFACGSEDDVNSVRHLFI
jgi:sedoheptulose-bisphosphatase